MNGVPQHVTRFPTVRRAAAVRVVALLLCGLLVAACAPFQRESLPASRTGGTTDLGAQLVATAMAQLGAPYRYGGSSPAQGFDCSGLVTYVYGRLGISVPRTAAQQFAAAVPVREQDLQLGDLVFFRLAGPRADVSHVGIYSGQGRFVHAPQSGRNVTEAFLADEFYRQRLAGFGRLLAGGQGPHTAAR